MRIGFDVSQTGGKKAGCGYLAASLIQALAGLPDCPEVVLYPTFGDQFWDPEWDRLTYRHPSGRWPRLLSPEDWPSSQRFWREPPPDFETQLGNPDIIHANNFFCPSGLKSARLVWTLHDLLFLEYPEWTTEANRQGCFEGSFRASLRADFIVANSRYSRDRFLHFFPHYPAGRIAVAHPASRYLNLPPAGPAAAVPDLKPGSFWLTVGTLEPRKNLEGLLHAWRRWSGAPPLVVAGGEGWMMEGWRTLTAGLDVRSAGYVDDTQLQWLYENCRGFVFPSRAEGFGMPVVEALSCGAAVVCADRTALPEVAGEAALYCNPDDPESILSAVQRVDGDPMVSSRLRDLARPRAALFNWSRSARLVLEVYHRVAGLQRFSHSSRAPDPGR